jgi:hypothetical protein
MTDTCILCLQHLAGYILMSSLGSSYITVSTQSRKIPLIHGLLFCKTAYPGHDIPSRTFPTTDSSVFRYAGACSSLNKGPEESIPAVWAPSGWNDGW